VSWSDLLASGEAPPTARFSVAERDRRWSLIRTLMASASLDLLVVPGVTESRYLTQAAYDVGPTIFPVADEVTLLSDTGLVGPAAWDWVTDIRPVGRRWADGIVTRLNELNANGKIVGVVGLDTSTAHPDGDMNYNTFIWMREAFPRTRWVGATTLLQEVRAGKSLEEITVLERAATSTDAGLLAAVSTLGVGILDREVWGQMALGAVRAAGDPPRHAVVGLAPLGGGHPPPGPIGRAAESGDLLMAGIRGTVAGYEAGGTQLAMVGSLPAEWRAAWAVHGEAWERACQVLVPGQSVMELDVAARSAATDRYAVRLEILGAGLGDDLPCFPPQRNDRGRLEPTVLEPNMALTLRPWVEWDGPSGRQQLTWSDTLVTTTAAPRRLGSRPRELPER
jgi:Xaa-Pro aminopeptidase